MRQPLSAVETARSRPQPPTTVGAQPFCKCLVVAAFLDPSPCVLVTTPALCHSCPQAMGRSLLSCSPATRLGCSTPFCNTPGEHGLLCRCGILPPACSHSAALDRPPSSALHFLGNSQTRGSLSTCERVPVAVHGGAACGVFPLVVDGAQWLVGCGFWRAKVAAAEKC